MHVPLLFNELIEAIRKTKSDSPVDPGVPVWLTEGLSWNYRTLILLKIIHFYRDCQNKASWMSLLIDRRDLVTQFLSSVIQLWMYDNYNSCNWRFSQGSSVSSAVSSYTKVSCSIPCVYVGKIQSCNWDPIGTWWGGTLRIRKHLLAPQRFRDEWSQFVAGPCSWLQQHTITMPSAGNPVWQRIALISTTTQSQSYQCSRDVAPGSESPGFYSSGSLSFLFSSPLLALHFLLCYILLSFSFFCLHPLPLCTLCL